MFRALLLTAFVIGAWAFPAPAIAAVWQNIAVDAFSRTDIRVDRKKIPLEELPDAFRAQIRGDDPVRAVIYVPLPADQKLLKEVIAKCRKGGATAFTVAYKS